MLFLSYWEIDENASVEQRFAAASKLANSGLFPPPNVKILRWDMTPDWWGIIVMEADNAADVASVLDVWRVAFDGFFRVTKTSPAMPVADSFPHMAKLLENWGSA